MKINIQKVENGFKMELGGALSRRHFVAETVDKVKEVISQEIDKTFRRA
jgi:hypothetical protein